MIRNAFTFAIASGIVLSLAAAAEARPNYRFAIYDQKGKTIYDDGKLDGKACVVGKKAFYNPKTGRFVVVPAARCNF